MGADPPNGLIIRQARLPEEAAQLKAFIDGLQRHEHAFEPNRRVDERVAEDYFSELMKRVAEREGRFFVAETKGALIGWLVSVVSTDMIYVVEDERSYGYIAELFVTEEWRHAGVGHALSRAAEDDFRARGFRCVQIGVLAGNTASEAAYKRWGFAPYAITLRKRI